MESMEYLNKMWGEFVRSIGRNFIEFMRILRFGII